MSIPTRTIRGIEAVGHMRTADCMVRLRNGEELDCLEYSLSECRCPGAPLNGIRGPGIWVEKQKYLELRLMGEIE